MPRLRLAARADLATFYEADAQRYGAGAPQLQVVSRDAFIAFYRGCPSIGFEHDGRPIGGILFDGEQAHIAVLPQYHGHWALLLKPALQWLFRLRREIVVQVDRDNPRAIAFMARHGWPCLHSDGTTLAYRLAPQGGTRKTAYPFARRAVGVRSLR
jgi:hypothetical protein